MRWGLWFASFGAVVSLLGCPAMENVSEPAVPGDKPNVNAATSARLKDVPYCPGGDRAKACIFGQNCRVTEQGCQVCQCHTMQ